MAKEITVQASLQIKNGNLNYRSNPTAFNDDASGADPKGPTPGAVTISTAGTDVAFGELITPGWCKLQNLDADNYVEYGIFSPTLNAFLVLGELGPGEVTVLKFSRNLLEQYSGAGSGTTGPINRFRMIANTASCYVSVEAFER